MSPPPTLDADVAGVAVFDGPGVKYGVNYWIHMYPFRTMQQGACGNQAYIQNWY